MRIFLHIFFWIILFFLSTYKVFAAGSTYVLPYPSEMPGSKWYFLYQVVERIEKDWYFGDFASFEYNLKYADKYLVEAKTLFEYDQYLLGQQAIKKSDAYFIKTHRSLEKAKLEGKNITEKEHILKEAVIKHSMVLEQLKIHVPKEFLWEPEKEKSTPLFLWEQIDHAVAIRRRVNEE